jgi:hypothetical protein
MLIGNNPFDITHRKKRIPTIGAKPPLPEILPSEDMYWYWWLLAQNHASRFGNAIDWH